MAETVTTEPDRDWEEDFAHENGNYFCSCCICGQEFRGHKRRVVCRECSQDKDAQKAFYHEEEIEGRLGNA